LGAGYDGNGLISNLKLFANYNISNSINLTVGSESKLLLGKSYNSETNGKVGSTISLIYGVQFEF
ncbi:MAG TPA: hypothetical protein PKV40_03130, partial [Candidatus Kapabacteria bacterium]|nr:hypothetical protein [Candidatus Kapabacteria bacterium]